MGLIYIDIIIRTRKLVKIAKRKRVERREGTHGNAQKKMSIQKNIHIGDRKMKIRIGRIISTLI